MRLSRSLWACLVLLALPIACGNSAGSSPNSAGAAGSSTAGDGGASAVGGASNDAGVSGSGGDTTGAAGDSGAAGEAALCPKAGAPVTRLSVSGAHINDPSGHAIQLRGWNWGQWGSEQDQDAADNAAQGANVVRIPLRWWGFYNNEGPDADPKTRIDARLDGAPGDIEPEHLRLLDKMVHDAACQGLWVDLFLDSNCGQGSATGDTAAYCGTGSDGKPANFSNDPATTERFIKVWEFLVEHYRDQAFIGMYELLPEPQFGCPSSPCSNWGAAPAFYLPVIERVRALDPLTPLLIGPDGGYEIKQLSTAYIPGGSGLVYTGDFLDGAAGHPEYVQYALDFQSKYHAPVFIQQLGSRKDDPDPYNRVTTILKAMNAAGLGWTWWTYRETRSKTGLGFAPYWENQGPPWSEDPAWLKVITDQFR